MSPETLVALIDINEVVGLKPLKISKSDIVKAIDLEDNIYKLTGKIIKNKPISITTKVKLSDAEKLAEAIMEADVSHQIQDLFSNDFSTIEVGGLLGDIIAYLQKSLPISEGASDMTRFIWKCRIIDNPLYILQLIATHQLTPLEVTCLKEAYPDTYDAIVQGFISNIIEEIKDVSKLHRPLKLMIAMLLESPILDDNTIKAYSTSENIKPTQLNLAEGQ
jgi:hypothetical protein